MFTSQMSPGLIVRGEGSLNVVRNSLHLRYVLVLLAILGVFIGFARMEYTWKSPLISRIIFLLALYVLHQRLATTRKLLIVDIVGLAL